MKSIEEIKERIEYEKQECDAAITTLDGMLAAKVIDALLWVLYDES